MMKISSGVHEKGTFTLMDVMLAAKAKENFGKSGAVGLFVGVARETSKSGEKVRKVMIEAYEEKANEVLREICRDLHERSGVTDVQIHHLLGEFNVGEDMVYVLVAGSHRDTVFNVLREAVERYKKEAPIFKKEYVLDRSGRETGRWVEEQQKEQPNSSNFKKPKV